MIELTRPLISLDVETHAFVSPEQSRIVELGFKVIYPKDGEDQKPPKRYVTYIKSDLMISEEAEKKHGISNEKIAHAPTFKQLAENLAKGFKDCDYCGYNINFDIKVLKAEFQRNGIRWSTAGAYLLDPLQLWRVMSPRTLSHAVREFLGREPTEAHRALGDAEDTLDVAMAQIERWALPHDLQKLHELCFDANNVDPDGKFIWLNGVAVCNFGKHGQSKTPLMLMPTAYRQWMLGYGDFSIEVKILVENSLKGIVPIKESR